MKRRNFLAMLGSLPLFGFLRGESGQDVEGQQDEDESFKERWKSLTMDGDRGIGINIRLNPYDFSGDGGVRLGVSYAFLVSCVDGIARWKVANEITGVPKGRGILFSSEENRVFLNILEKLEQRAFQDMLIRGGNANANRSEAIQPSEVRS